METEKLYYKKVFIKSEADVPEKYGYYITNLGVVKFGGIKDYNRFTRLATAKILWYFKPVANLRPVRREKIIERQRTEICHVCSGTGIFYSSLNINGGTSAVCPICNGTGKEVIIEKFATELSELKDGIKESSLTDEFSRPYSISEYTHQIERMTKILGKRPAVFEQGVNALLLMIEQPTIARSQLEVKESWQSNVTDEEVKEKGIEFIGLYGYSTTLVLEKFANWLRSRLQPAKTICVNCDELKSCSNICMDCVKKIVDENMQPPKDSKLTDEEIEKCSYQYLSDVSESTNTERKYEKIGFIKGAKAALSGQIAEWRKRNKEQRDEK